MTCAILGHESRFSPVIVRGPQELGEQSVPILLCQMVQREQRTVLRNFTRKTQECAIAHLEPGREFENLLDHRLFPSEQVYYEAMIDCVYLGVLAALAVFSITRWRPAPFTFCMSIAAVQAVSVATGDGSASWLRYVWLPGEAVLCAAAVVLTAYLVRQQTADLPADRRLHLRIAAAAIGVSISGLVWLTSIYTDPYWIFLAFRGRMWTAIAVSLAVLATFGTRRPDADGLLWFALAGAHAITGPFLMMGYRPLAQVAYRVIVSAAGLLWLVAPLYAAVALRRASRGSQTIPGTH